MHGLAYGVAVMGISIALRVLRYPDLTADGSFLLGAAVFTRLLLDGTPWPVGLMLAMAAGGTAGIVTALLHNWLGVGRLLSGILTTMGSYSVVLRLLRDRPSVNIPEVTTMFSDPLVMSLLPRNTDPTLAQLYVCLGAAVMAGLLILWLLRSEIGLVLRAAGDNRPLIRDSGHTPVLYEVLGLFLANGLVAASGVLVCTQQGFVDIGTGVGIVVTLIAALVLGEQVVPLRTLPGQQFLAPLVGASAYYLLYLGVLRASVRGWLPLAVRATDLKVIAAITIVVSIVISRLRRSEEAHGDPLPL